MIYKDVVFGSTRSDLVAIDKNELKARICIGADVNSEIVKHYVDIYNHNVTYRYAYVRIPFSFEDGVCCFEDKSIDSNALSKVLKETKEVLLVAVTAGIVIDKLIEKNEIMNPSSAYFIDAVASAGVESYLNYISKEICKNLNVTNRFSPGYADFPLEFQSYLLDRLSAKENIGIMLSRDYLMIPMKSITAVIGIK